MVTTGGCEVRGLCLSTRENRIAEALRFMKSLRIEGRAAWSTTSMSGIDAYVASVTVSRRTRGSLKSATVVLRRLLRYLKISGWIKHDLGGEILVPKCYKLEDLPRELRAEHVDKVLETTRADHSAIGRRDYAILTLLATYGLRAGEIIGLRLEDIDWKNDILRVRRGDSGAYGKLRLLPHPGNTILAYLRHGRPKMGARQVFVRTVAPYTGLAALTTQIRQRLAVVGATSPGRRGPHAFRHARAASLLREGVTIKEIGDVLGHRSRSNGRVSEDCHGRFCGLWRWACRWELHHELPFIPRSDRTSEASICISRSKIPRTLWTRYAPGLSSAYWSGHYLS